MHPQASGLPPSSEWWQKIIHFKSRKQDLYILVLFTITNGYFKLAGESVSFFKHYSWPSWTGQLILPTQNYNALFYLWRLQVQGWRRLSREWRQPPGTSLRKKRRVGRPFQVGGVWHIRALRTPITAGPKPLETLVNHSSSWWRPARGGWFWYAYWYIKIIYFSSLPPYTSSLCPKLVFHRTLITKFFCFVCRHWGRWGRWMRWKGLQHAWSERTPGAGDGLGGYPCELASGPLAATVHRANALASPPSGAPSLSVERQQAPSPLEQAPKEPITLPPPTMSAVQRRISQNCRWHLFPEAHLRP